MRLGQLARKYGVSLHEIISYLQQVDPDSNKLGRNSKLNDQLTSQVAKHFENLELLNEEPEKQEQSQAQEQSQTQEQEQIQAQAQEQEQEPVRQPGMQVPEVTESEVQEPQKKDEVAIETDKLLEMLESEENPADLDKITLIKAPKRELDGLKVVGKIELPEPKRKTGAKDEQSEQSKDPRHDRKGNRKPARRELSEEELEKRRLKAKRRKEQYEAREEKRRKEKEKQQRKALNKARYQQKLQHVKSNQPKPKDKFQKQSESTEVQEPPAPPKTLLGKFWRWMNT